MVQGTGQKNYWTRMNTDEHRFKKPLNALSVFIRVNLCPIFVFLLCSSSLAADFTAKSIGDHGNVTVMEVTGNYDANNPDGSTNALPRQIIAKEFFKTHKDEYDFLVIFTNFGFKMPEKETSAFYEGVKNDTQGLGIDLFDNTDLYGSSGKLQGTIDMGNLSVIATDPLDPKFQNTLYILSHELMHRWGAHVKFKDASGNLSSTLLGHDGAHWSYLLDSGGSVIYGNQWQDNKDGTFTSTTPQGQMKFYSPLDLYLMGMIDKSKVPPMLLIDNPNVDSTQLPQADIKISGTARSVTIDDIIAAVGPRVPDASTSQKSFKTAFIFVTQPGTFIGSELYGIENVRSGGITRFSVLTDGQSIMQVASTPKDDIPANPGITITPSTPRTLPPNINDGVQWLVSNQKNDGSWADQSRTAERDTVAATLALKSFTVTQTNYQSGINWLEGISSGNMDFFARKIQTLSGEGQDLTSLVNDLLSRQNADGGWGSDMGYPSNPADTALVLKALSAAGYTGLQTISQTIDYLKSAQNPDGGWGNEDNGSMVQETSNVLSAFNTYRAAYQLDNAIMSGLTLLASKQNPDGGFGNSPSTVYDTAAAMLSLMEVGTPKAMTDKALNYLLSGQAGDGSWNHSPYQTALAVNAVYKVTVDPDLAIKIEDISFIPANVTTLPTKVVISANIWNLGTTAVPAAKVIIYDGTPATGTKIGEQTLVFTGQQATTVTFPAVITDGNEHVYTIVVDPDNLVKEPNKMNNSAVKVLYPQETYDFEVLPANLTVRANPVNMMQDAQITAKISNKGTMNAYNVQVKYYIDDPVSPFDISTQTIDIPAGQTITNSITWRTNKSGLNMPLTVLVDPFNAFLELSEDNNKASAPITVNVDTRPNLTVSYKNIVISPSPANERGDVNISALIKNEGFSTASNIVVNFYKGVPGAGGVLIGTKTIPSLVSGESAAVGISWQNIQEAGEKVIYIQTDPDNLVNEIREDDNDAFTTLSILNLPDLVVSTNSIEFSPALPKEGDLVTISATVLNKGQQSASNVTVQFSESGMVIDTITTPLISGSGSAVVSTTYDTAGKKGVHSISLIVDPGNVVAEKSKDNNSASRTFGVQDMNLWVTELFISPNGDGVKDKTEFFFRFDVPQSVKVVVMGQKGEAVRTFGGGELENTSGGHVIWDGLNDAGTLVGDGKYQMQVVSQDGQNLGGASVVVDNNRSSFQEAIGTDYIQDLSLSWWSPFNGYPKGWFGDESGILFEGEGPSDSNNQIGLYKYSPGDKGVEKLTPYEWKEFEFQANFSKKDGRLAVISEPCYYCSKDKPAGLWLLDEADNKWNKLDEGEAYGIARGYSASMLTPRWSPDGTKIAYQKALSTGGWGLFIINADGVGRTRIDDSSSPILPGYDNWGDIGVPFRWSPSGEKIAYKTRDGIWVNDLSGNRWKILDQDGDTDYLGIFWSGNNKIVSTGYSYPYYPVVSVDVINPSDKKFLGPNDWESAFISPDGSKAVVFDDSQNRATVLDIKNGRSLEITENELEYFGWYKGAGLDSYWLAHPEKLWSYDSSRFYLLQSMGSNRIDNYTSAYDVRMLVIDFNKFEFKEIIVGNTVDGILEYPQRGETAGIWMNDNRTLLIPFLYQSDYKNYVMTSIDTESGTVQKTPLKMNYFEYAYSADFGYSPLGDYIYHYNPEESDWASFIFRSLMNLTADLSISSNSSSVSIKGTAADMNFEGYKLEYADTKKPNTWGLIQPPADTPVIDDLFTNWVPPHEGTYYVRLTVWDKAGNMLSKQKRVSWGLTSNVTNIHKALNVFSPNGDGVMDAAQLKYTVLQPVHLEFTVTDQNDNLIKAIAMDHPSPGDASMSWDGTDGSGKIVQDGSYKIKVLDFVFLVKVDNTPPDVNIVLGDIKSTILLEEYMLYLAPTGHAIDPNLKDWTVESGEGDNPLTWHKIISGEALLARKDSNGKTLYPIQDDEITKFSWSDIGNLKGEKIRITAADLAGNKSTSVTDFVKESFILYGWDGQKLQPNGTERIPAVLSRPGIHTIEGFETLRTATANINIQYLGRDRLWHDSRSVADISTGKIKLEWDTASLNQDILAVRLRAVDILGQEHYSNALATASIFDVTPGTECTTTLSAKNFILEKLTVLKFQVKSSQDSRYPAWTDYKVYDASKGDIVPQGQFFMDVPAWKQGMMYQVRMTGVGQSGHDYTSEPASFPPPCPVGIKLTVSYKEADCGALSSVATFDANIKYNGATSNVSLKSVSYYIQTGQGMQLLQKIGNITPLGSRINVDTSILSPGSYPVKAVLSYVDMDKNLPVETSVSAVLVVDRVLPIAQLTYPSGNTLKICPVKVSDAGGDRFVVQIEGLAGDDNVVSKYEVSYGISDNPASWVSADIFGNSSKSGSLGNWVVNDLNGTDFSLRLKVVDAAGNVSCTTTAVSLNTGITIDSENANPALFSPNGDGKTDVTRVRYQISDYASTGINVFKLLNTGNNYSLDSSALRTIPGGAQQAGLTDVSWDGKGDDGNVVPDGKYGIATSAGDSCGHTAQNWTAVEVDNTPPTVLISYPLPGAPLGNIVEVRGTAYDLHFQSYILEAGQGDNPDTWTSVSSRLSPVSDGVLGVWNTFGLNGKWTIRLTANDEVGNTNITTVLIDLGKRQNLIKSLKADPVIFSPNNDGKIDISTIQYELTEICDIKMEIIDAHRVVKKRYSSTSVPAASQSMIWDGTDDAGAAVPDGVYSARLTAVLSSDSLIDHVEVLSITVDTSSPVVNITQPVANSFVRSDVALNGSITDNNISDYSISLTGPKGTTVITQGNQSRADYTFGILNDLPDGAYTLTATANDMGQNAVIANVTFTVDKTAPALNLDTPKDGGYYGGQNAAVNISGSVIEKNFDSFSLQYGLGDPPAQWTELAGGAAVPTVQPIFSWKVGPDDSVPDGSYMLSLSVRDKAGYVREAGAKVIIDNTSPVVTIASPKEGDLISAATDVTGTAFDQYLDKYTLAISQGQCSEAYQWAVIKTADSSIQGGVLASWQALPQDGNYCIRVTAQDKAGNTTETKVNIKIYTHHLAVPVLTGFVDNKKTAHLSWIASPDAAVAGYNIYRNGQQINTSLITATDYLDLNMSEGIYVYTIKAVDFVGLNSGSSNQVGVTIDATGPDARIQLPHNEGRVGGLVEIMGTAHSAADFKNYRVSIGQGQSPLSWIVIRTSPLPIAYGVLAQWNTIGFADGQIYSIKLEAEDISGNITMKQVAVTVDNTSPGRPAIVSAVAGSSTATITWNANADLDLAGYLVYRNDQLANASGTASGNMKPYLVNGTSYADNNLPDGTFKYYIIAMDQAGNMSEQSDIRQISIDTHPPHTVITSPAEKTKFDQKLLIKAESPDLDITKVQFQYKRIQGGAWTNLGGPVLSQPWAIYADPASLGLIYGDYQVMAVATDQGGNTDPSPAHITLTYADITPPAVPNGLAIGTNGGNISLTWAANNESDLAGYNLYRTAGTVTTKTNAAIINGGPNPAYQDSIVDKGAYAYQVTAVDIHGNESKPSSSSVATVYAPVITQPYTPVQRTSVQIHGTAAAANSNVAVYVQTVDGYELLGSVAADDAGAFTVNGISLSPGENKIIARATDIKGNVSKDADMVVVVYDNPPGIPTGLSAYIQGHDINLSWNPNPETDIIGYNLYRDGVKLNEPTAIDTGQVTFDASSAINSYSYYSPAWARDQYAYTYWMPGDGTSTANPAWWEMSMSSPELISHVEIEWGTDIDSSGNNILYAGKDFEIQIWSGYAWVTQVKVTGNSVKSNVFDFKPSYRTDRIRLYITDSTDRSVAKQVRLVEVRVLKDNLISAMTPPSYVDRNLVNKQYNYTLTAVDNSGFESQPTDPLSAVMNAALPSAPGLTVSVQNSDVVLSWTSSVNSRGGTYNIYKIVGLDWVNIGRTSGGTTTYADTGQLNGSYSYAVTALDAGENESTMSNVVTATVSISPPASPTSLTVTPLPEGGLVAVWVYSGGSTTRGSAVAGFNLYRSTTSGGPYNKVNKMLLTTTTYLDSGLVNGATYYYVLTAVDGLGNLSSYSNEAYGTSIDSVAPAKPAIFFPTVAGMPVTLPSSVTNIAGSAEPGSSVELFQNGEYLGKTTGQLLDSMNSSPFTYDGKSASIAPNGKMLAYTYNNAVWLKDLATGTVTEVIPEALMQVWSPDSLKIAYNYYDTSGSYRIGIYDFRSETRSALTDDAATNENSPSWSADGAKISFTNPSGVWLKDIKDGSITRVVASAGISRQQLSPDGNRIAYFENYLYVIDLVSGERQMVDDNTDWYTAQWSPDGKKLAFVSNRNGNGDVYVLNYDTGDQTRIIGSSSYPFNINWTADGHSVLFASWDGDSKDKLWIADIYNQSPVRRIISQVKYSYYLGASITGIIAAISGDVDNSFTFYSMMPAGYFEFSDVTLNPGDNDLTVMATDAVGNKSPLSDSISVGYNPQPIPDLIVTSDNVSLYPLLPMTGQKVAINAVISNAGKTEVSDVDVAVYSWSALGQIELLKSETISSIPAGSSATVAVSWDSTGKIGDNSILVVVDSENKIAELDENNNMAVKELYVADHPGISITAATDSPNYSSNKLIGINLTLRNSGPSKDAVLQIQIEDANGYPVTTFESRALTLDYGSQKLNFTWSTGATFAGTYTVHPVLKDGTGVLAEDRASFTISPDNAIDLIAATDKLAYGPGENVVTNFTVKNTGANNIIPAVQAHVSITDAAGTVLFSETKTMSNLLPGTSIDLSSLWNSGFTAPGRYQAIVAVSMDGTTKATNASVFSINQSIVLTGAITVSSPVVAAGNAAQTIYTITNTGNADASGYTARISIIDPDSQAVVQTYDNVLDIARNTSKSGQLVVNTTGYGLKTYKALLQLLYQGTIRNIANASLTVKDLVYPTVVVASPTANSTYSNTIAISATASDDASGIDKVEYQIDGGVWKLLPVIDSSQGRYAATWEPSAADNGLHAVRFRATDKAGNTNITVQVGFMIQVNTLPPVAVIAGTPSSPTRDTGVTLIVGGSDVVAYKYKFDSGNYSSETAVAAQIVFSGLAEGKHTIYVMGKNSAGIWQAEANASRAEWTVDNTPPNTDISVGMPKFASADGTFYVVKDAIFTLAATDNLSGVKMTEYRVDGGQWTVYAPFKIATEGSHLIEFRSVDNLGNMEAVRTLSVIVDNTPPITDLTIGTPKYESGGTTYVAGKTTLTLTGKDQLSGVEKTEFRIDGASWATGTSIILPGEGTHTIAYRSKDTVGNMEDEKSVTLTVDNTPPVTNIEFSYQKYSNGQGILVSRETQVILSASDNLSGVKGTYYRFDDEAGWRSYSGAFKLAELSFGSHAIHFTSADNVENSEAEKIITVTVVAVEVETEIKNLPRVLVWIGDNKAYDEDKIDEEEEKDSDNSEPYNEANDESDSAGAVINYTTDAVKAFVASAFNDPDIYSTITTDKKLFIDYFRSGIYNMVVIFDQNRPLGKTFLRELKEGVNRGTGLFVSGWRNKSAHIMEELLGIKYKGSMSGHDKVRQIGMYQSPISSEQILASKGRIQKTVLREGTLAGIVKGEEICDGVNGVSLNYSTSLTVGDKVTVSLSVPSGKKMNLIDEETLYIDALPSTGVNANAATGSRDISIDGAASDGVNFSINSSSGYLKSSYSISVTVEHPNGSSTTTGKVAVTPTCNSKVGAGMTIGPLNVIGVLQDTHTKTEGVPAAVLNSYGEGKTVFLGYNIVESAMNSNTTEYASIMKSAANYILPQEAKPEAGVITLLETKIRPFGNDMDIKAEDTLGEGLTFLPLFNLTKEPLEYTFHLSDGQEGSYRYFVRIRDRKGDYTKNTAVSLGINGGYELFDRYQYLMSIESDSDLLMQQAVSWVNEQLALHPELSESLSDIRDELTVISFMPRLSASDIDKVIHQVVQTIHHINQLHLDTTDVRMVLDGYLMAMEGNNNND